MLAHYGSKQSHRGQGFYLQSEKARQSRNMLQVLVSPWTSNTGNIWELVINAESHSRSTELESAFYQICAGKKKKIELPYDPAIPLLGIFRERTIIRKDACTLVHSSTTHNSQDMGAT